MRLNKLILSGRLANFKETYYEKTEEKKAFCTKFINLQSDRKDEETGYYESIPVKIIAFGVLAERLHNFAPMEEIVFTGKLSFERYNDKDGLERRNLTVIIEDIANWPAAMNTNNENTETPEPEAKTAPAKPASKKPKMPSKKPTPKPKKTA